MDNLDLYNKVRKPPQDALKKITGGRLNGKTDINPMWRIKALTENFGACGVGWKYTIERFWLEKGEQSEVAAFAEIKLYIATNDGWSEAIPGIGGSMFVTKEKSGLYTSDECYKMALTDALSVACKALGLAADIYWEADKTKYSQEPPKQAKADPPAFSLQPEEYAKHIGKLIKGTSVTPDEVKQYIEGLGKTKASELTYEEFMKLVDALKDTVQNEPD